MEQRIVFEIDEKLPWNFVFVHAFALRLVSLSSADSDCKEREAEAYHGMISSI